jgi:hypothetical protein
MEYIKRMINNKIERKTRVDINDDGRIGGLGLDPVTRVIGKIEQKTHIDLNGNNAVGR